MKAAWIRNFWTKTVAFLLAAALVPIILTYAVGLVYSYGGMGRDFYTSDLCLTAVGKKTWEICDDYIAMEGGNYELDKIYSKGRQLQQHSLPCDGRAGQGGVQQRQRR